MSVLLLSLLAFAKRLGSGALSWLTHASFWQLVALGLLGLAVVQHFTLIDARHDAAKWQKQYADEHNGRIADRQAYQAAQAQAAATNKAQVQKVELQYQRNSDDERQAYLRDLAQLRADRMRARNPAPPGSTSPTAAPAPSAAAPRIDADGVCVPATSDVCEAGAEIELRLMHLQNLVEKQIVIDPNAEPAK